MNKSVLINLGTVAASGFPFTADIVTILRSNLLVQAGSGGGKSWLLRRMIEQTFGIVPQVIIDPEGEFSTLREKYDVILVGKDGDTPADIRSAELLAHRILELGVSAVVDLYEMSPLVRPVWVAKFVQAFVDAPKNLWRDLLVYVDEAHTMAPEPGHGAVDSEAHRRCRSALIEFASRGRKRGYGLVAATQRLGKLSKDFAAELKNVIVGQTFMDVDRERAAGSLGIAKADKSAFFKKIKTVAPGAFYAMGRALLLEPELVKIGRVETQHPEAGRRQAPPPPPTSKIRHLLPQLADLPREAEVKVATEKELRARVAELERQVVAKSVPLPGPEKKVEVPYVPEDWREAVQSASVDLSKANKETCDWWNKFLPTLAKVADKLKVSAELLPPQPARPVRSIGLTFLGNKPPKIVQVLSSALTRVIAPDYDLPKCARVLLGVLARREGTNISQLAILSGYSRSCSGFANSLSILRVKGFVVGDRNDLRITTSGAEAAGNTDPMPHGDALLEYWAGKLDKCSRTLLKLIYDVETVSKTDLSINTGYSETSSGFANSLSKLRVLGLVEGSRGEDITISGVFKE